MLSSFTCPWKLQSTAGLAVFNSALAPTALLSDICNLSQHKMLVMLSPT